MASHRWNKKAKLTKVHEIGSLERKQTRIRQTGTGVTECRNDIEEREPSGRNVFMLGIKDIIVVPSPGRDVRGHNDESSQLEKYEILDMASIPVVRKQVCENVRVRLTATTMMSKTLSALYSTPPNSSICSSVNPKNLEFRPTIA